MTRSEACWNAKLIVDGKVHNVGDDTIKALAETVLRLDAALREERCEYVAHEDSPTLAEPWVPKVGDEVLTSVGRGRVVLVIDQDIANRTNIGRTHRVSVPPVREPPERPAQFHEAWFHLDELSPVKP